LAGIVPGAKSDYRKKLTVKKEIDEGVDLCQPNKEGLIPIHLAISKAHF
jgi:hypothetical protein